MSTNGENTNAEETKENTNVEETNPEKPDPRDPSGFLGQIIGQAVTVKLNSGIVYKGALQSVDGYMNIALEDCKEVADGRVLRRHGDSFIRGNNVTYIAADEI